MASSRSWLSASNLVVSGGFAAGSVLLSDEPRHAIATAQSLVLVLDNARLVAQLRDELSLVEQSRVAYFVVTAAVGNAIKYAGPDAVISVTIASSGGPEGEPAGDGDAGFLAVEVRDDGPGGADPDGHGLTLMAERVASVGGDLRITSPAGEGTAIRAILPRRL